jgi:endonuclease/exonuclease/phosphatase family metal-dependent hydrolase
LRSRARRVLTWSAVALGLWVASCATSPAPRAARLRVLAYNVKHGLGLDGAIDLERIAALIRALDVDVVTLQEIDAGCARSGGVDQARALGELCGMQPRFGPFMDYDGGQYGMALLSRLPIVATTNVRLPDGAEPRTALEARIRTPGAGPEVIVTSVHLYRTEEERLAQARVLRERYAGARLPVILAGDFNSQRGSSVMELLEEEWFNPPKRGQPNTFPADAPEREIDFVLVRGLDRDAVVLHEVVPETVASDHRPILIEIEFR